MMKKCLCPKRTACWMAGKFSFGKKIGETKVMKKVIGKDNKIVEKLVAVPVRDIVWKEDECPMKDKCGNVVGEPRWGHPMLPKNNRYEKESGNIDKKS